MRERKNAVYVILAMLSYHIDCRRVLALSQNRVLSVLKLTMLSQQAVKHSRFLQKAQSHV